MKNKLNHYLVTSAPMEHGSYDYCEPPETYCETCQIEAKNKSEAKILSLHHPDMQEWIEHCRRYNENPFHKMVVQDFKCDHGKCWCDKCIDKFGECDKCIKESEKYFESKTNEK